jgi:rubrerythrin
VDEFMAHAYTLEVEAAERYEELAALMTTHNNREVAELFAKLARIESKHRDQIAARMGWTTVPEAPDFRWETPEGPETTDFGDLHYLMRPWHALKLAEHNERRAVEFFERTAAARVPAAVRAAAREMAEDEREHVRLIEKWLATVPPPSPGWDEDMDPPSGAD